MNYFKEQHPMLHPMVATVEAFCFGEALSFAYGIARDSVGFYQPEQTDNYSRHRGDWKMRAEGTHKMV